MTKVIEKILKLAILREVRSINSAIVLEDEKKNHFIQTSGVNFNILNSLSFREKLNLNKVASNDIQAISHKYGVNI